MKPLWHLVMLGSLVCVCASPSLGQKAGSEGGRSAGLTLSANVTPASILELSSKSNYVEELKTTSPAQRLLKIVPADTETADLVKQIPAGTLLMIRVEFLARFSGFREETATVLITATSVDDKTGHLILTEGATEDSLTSLQPGQTIRLEGVRSGARIVRYVGFRVDETVGAVEKNGLGATLKYEIIP